MSSHRLPAAEIVPILVEFAARWAAEGNVQEEDVVSLLAERTGLVRDTIDSVFRGRHETIDFDFADKLIQSMHMPMAWHTHPVLREHYWQGDVPPDYSKPVKCAHPRCDNWFELEESNQQKGRHIVRRLYCSARCKGHANAIQRGDIRSLEDQETKCRKGHRYDRWGVYETPDGKKVCRRCRALAKRRYDKKPEVRARKAAALRRRRERQRQAVAA